MRRLGHVAVQSQFATFRHDCTVDALEMALHTVAPGRVPVTPGALDALVRAAVATGETRDAQGAMTAADLAWLCAHEGAPCTQVVGVAAGMAAIRQWGGIKPLVVQVLHGWALPGNEPGVEGHAVACFGYDPLADVCELGNGDSARG